MLLVLMVLKELVIAPMLLLLLKALKARQEVMRGRVRRPGITLSATICSADITRSLVSRSQRRRNVELELIDFPTGDRRPVGREKNLSRVMIRVDFSTEVHTGGICGTKGGYMGQRFQPDKYKMSLWP